MNNSPKNEDLIKRNKEEEKHILGFLDWKQRRKRRRNSLKNEKMKKVKKDL